ncbi:immunoglobulin superfamily member 3 [Hyla sarda]|uniref:immunoglobulin superfamily member 3 n=1 Tax=Hyla sarda TaxID=327740 RepID=UPI0024C4038D|nr:immunoglobulin superfamily member 3 [Hyla sarda]
MVGAIQSSTQWFWIVYGFLCAVSPADTGKYGQYTRNKSSIPQYITGEYDIPSCGIRQYGETIGSSIYVTNNYDAFFRPNSASGTSNIFGQYRECINSEYSSDCTYVGLGREEENSDYGDDTGIGDMDELQIINLSSYSLSTNEISLLKRGLSFTPTPRFDTFTWVKDINLFARKLCLHKWHQQHNDPVLTAQSNELKAIEVLEDLLLENIEGPRGCEGPLTNLRPKSRLTPSLSQYGSIDTFVNLVVKEIEKIRPTQKMVYTNLAAGEREALENLRTNTDIIIKASDKGGNVVLLDRSEYIRMCLALLEDHTKYQRLKTDPTIPFLRELKSLLTSAKESSLISMDEYNFIYNPNPTIATFYSLPKTHKNTQPLRGRPIISGNDNLTQGASIYVDQFLAPLVTSLPSYLKDTKDTVTKLQDLTVTDSTMLASIDVESLYTNIRHDLGITAVKKFLNTRSIHFKTHNEFVIDLLTFVLTHNYFLFDDTFFFQTQGTAMGSTCAPNYANLFLGWWESEFVFSDDFEHYTSHIIFWGRFIDDVLILWDGGSTLFTSFLEALNHNDIGMHFTSEFGGRLINFLDLTIMIDETNTIQTKVFRKPTSTNNLLHWQSWHPVTLRRSIPVGQFLRAKRNCSTQDTFEAESVELSRRFRARGYPLAHVKKAHRRANNSDRRQLLTSNRVATEHKIRCIGTYDAYSTRIYNILRRYWPILYSDPDLREVVGVRPQVTFRRGSNIKDILVRSHLPSLEETHNRPRMGVTGSFPCGHCSFCKYLPKTQEFSNPLDGRQYQIRQFINCSSKNIIYAARCSCHKLYVVIPDSLLVSSSSQNLQKVEGSSLQLSCDVSHNTAQHTHLSISWYRRNGEQAEEVISLTRDFLLRPGPSYAQRFLVGDVRMDKVGNSTFRLTVYNLQPADQGAFYCQGTEWIEDPDRSWFPMTRKKSEESEVIVQAMDKDFNVRLETDRRTYSAGEAAELRCIIEAQNAADRVFAVSWAFNSSLMGSLSPGGVASLTGDYSQRESHGELRVARDSDSIFSLKIFRLRPEDSGKYNCRVTERERAASGDMVDRDSKRPKNIPITVSPLKTSVTVTVVANSSSVLEGSRIFLTCLVASLFGPQSRISASWHLQDTQNRQREVIQQDRDGVTWASQAYRDRASSGGLRMVRSGSDTFTLELESSQRQDAGSYECRVTEWLPSYDGDWQRLGERSAKTSVEVTSLESGFVVMAISRTPGVSYYDSFDLQCILKPHFPSWVGVSVTWRFQPSSGGDTHDLVTFSRSGGVQWGERAGNFRGRSIVEKADSSHNVRLSVSRASESEAGKYQCVAELWRREYNGSWARLAERTSNLLEIRVQPPVSRLQVGKGTRSVTVLEGAAVTLTCTVRSQSSPDSRFSVLWFAQEPSGADGKLIVRSGASMEYGTYAEEADLKERLQLEELTPGHYTLTLRGALQEDSGGYYCQVEEWVLDPNQAWYQLAKDSSGLTEVNVKKPDNNLQVDQLPRNVSSLEGESFMVTCQVLNRTLPQSRLALEWLVWRAGEPERRTVARVPLDGIALTTGEDEDRGGSEVPSRLHLWQPSPGLHTLTLQQAEEQDSGAYSCRVQEWLQDPRGQWYRRAEERSAATYVSVRRPDADLLLDAAPLNVSVQDGGHVALDCTVLSRSRPESQLAVSWSFHSRSRGAEQILTTDRSGVWSPLSPRWEGRLQQIQLSPTMYKLRIPQAGPADSGNYTCSVQEWMMGPRGDWYLLAQDESLVGWVTVQGKESNLQSVICSNDALFYLVFFYPFPIFGILIITILLVRFRSRPSSKTGEGKNGVPLLWIKEPHLNYSPTCLEPPVLSIHPGTID